MQRTAKAKLRGAKVNIVLDLPTDPAWETTIAELQSCSLGVLGL